MIFAFPPFELDEELFELRRDGERVPAQPKVLALLFFLLRERSRTVTKAEILEALWPGVFVSDASLTRAVGEARKALEDDAQELIVTVRQRGLRFAAKVTARDPAPRSERAPTEPPPAARTTATTRTIIAREAVLSALRARADEAKGDRGAVVWLVGEGGIGKTFVLEAFAREALASGARVAWARSHRDDAVPPYWSWTQIARTLGDPGASALTVLDDLRRKEVGDDARFALFDAVTQALLAPCTPLVLLFDDVEHADDASMALLRFVARETRDAPVLVVASLRDSSAVAAANVSLRTLLRDRGEHLLALRRFGRADVELYLQSRSDAPVPAALIDAILDKSGGNPLFVTRLLGTEWAVRAIADAQVEVLSSLDLQAGLLESIDDHLSRLSKATVEALASAAVLGRSFSFAALAATSGAPAETLLDALAEATERKLVAKNRGDYQFSHALVRDVLARRVPAAERPARHQAAGRALLAVYGEAADAHATELAYHFLRAAPAGEAELARVWSVRAAQVALQAGEPVRAASHFADAIEALAFSPGATAERLEVQLELAEALSRAHAEERAAAAYLDAAMLARAFASKSALVEALVGYAGISSADPLVLPELLREAEATAAGLSGPEGEGLRAAVAAALTRARASVSSA